jgi:hypothetical protein
MRDKQMSSLPSNPKSEIRNPKFVVEWDPSLVEEAVVRAVEKRGVRGFRGQRNRLYEISDPEEREAAFRDFHAIWFKRLDLDGVVRQALQEQPLIPASTRTCILAPARTKRDEGAELFVSPSENEGSAAEGRWVVVRLEPETLLDRTGALAFLRHELMHIADMLDPAFGYEPRLPRAASGPAHERLLQDRYRVLWETFIDGRLVRLGRAAPAIRDIRLREFSGTFPMLGERAEEAFARFFDGPPCTHADLVCFASNPVAAASSAPFHRFSESPILRNTPHAGQRCSLCGFPTHAFDPDPDRLPPAVQHWIRADFPAWKTDDGLCLQCSDLYSSCSVAPAPAR